MKIKEMIREIVITTILETEIDVTLKATIKLQTDNIKELENKKTKIEKLVLKKISTPLKLIYKDKPIKVIITPEIYIKDYNLDLANLILQN